MGAPQQQAKVLRIGIIQGGKITEERLIDKGESVTIGSAESNTFVIADDSLPKSLPLFVAKNNKGYGLSFDDTLQGKVSVSGAVLELDALKQRKETKKEQGRFVFPLSAEMRGKVTVNDTSILFQFVPPPVAVAAGSFGAASYLGWRNRIDWIMMGIFICSFVAHFGFSAYVQTLDPPPEPTFTKIPPNFAKFLKRPEPKEPEPKEELPSDEEKVDEKAAPKAEEKAPEKAEPEKVVPQTKEERKAAAKEKVKSKGLLAVLGTQGASKKRLQGGVADIMDSTGGDLDKFVKSDASLASAGSSGLRSGDYGHAPPTEIDGPEIAAKEVAVKQRQTSGPTSRVDAVEDVVGSLDSKKIQTAVRKYRSAVDACHTRVLNKNPNVSGRVVMQVTLDPSGTVLDIQPVQNTTGSSAITKCLQLRMKRWKFPKFEGDIAQFNLPFVFTAQG